MSWGKANWHRYRDKHAPKANRPWLDTIKYTKSYEAKYGLGVNIQTLEMSAVECEVAHDTGEIRLTNPLCGKIHPGNDFSELYLVCDRIIGASDGKETDIVLVQWDEEPLGSVHGHPITEEDLLRKLRRHNFDEIDHYREIRRKVRGE